MTLYLPVWLISIVGVVAAVVIIGLAIVGVLYLAAFWNWYR